MSDVDQRPPGAVVRFDVYSHHVRASNFNKRVLDALYDYCGKVATYKKVKRFGRYINAMDKVFVGVTHDRQRFSFHVNDLKRVIDILGHHGIPQSQIWIVEHSLYEPTPVNLESIDTRKPEGEQGEMIDYIVADGKTKILKLEPGGGKTFIALSAFNRLGVRVFLNIRSMYIKKWIGDIEEAFNTQPGDILVIKGTPDFVKMLAMAEEGTLRAKFIVCSNRTYFQYLKNYEFWRDQIKEMGYKCYPWELYEFLGVGIRVIDEVHQDFHLNYRQDLYSHVPKTLSMSGSLEADASFVNERNDVMFPQELQYHHEPLPPHAAAEAIGYRIENAANRVQWINNALGYYSHTQFEKSILKKKKLKRRYFEMVADLVRSRYINKRQPGQKMIVYFHLVETCTEVAELFKELFPEVNVARYVDEDPYEEMLEGDLIISTVRSLGVAIDVPDLFAILLTDALNSRQSNLQVMGRLRKLRDYPDIAPVFYYLVCLDIDKHIEYHNKKVELFKTRVVRHDVLDSKYVL